MFRPSSIHKCQKNKIKISLECPFKLRILFLDTAFCSAIFNLDTPDVNRVPRVIRCPISIYCVRREVSEPTGLPRMVEEV
jgi:hypothetical protein